MSNAQVGYALAGDIGAQNAHDIHDRLVEFACSVHHELVLDLSRVGHLDSTGLRMLLAVRDEVGGLSQEFRVVAPSPSVRRLLSLSGLLGGPLLEDGV